MNNDLLTASIEEFKAAFDVGKTFRGCPLRMQAPQSDEFLRILVLRGLVVPLDAETATYKRIA